MYCPNCGNHLDDNVPYCTRCGAAQTPPQPRQYQQQPNYTFTPRQTVSQESNVFAIVGFVLSFFFCIAGLILSILGLKQAREQGGNGKGLAVAGIVISAIQLAAAVLAVIFYIIIIIVAIGVSGSIGPF